MKGEHGAIIFQDACVGEVRHLSPHMVEQVTRSQWPHAAQQMQAALLCELLAPVSRSLKVAENCWALTVLPKIVFRGRCRSYALIARCTHIARQAMAANQTGPPGLVWPALTNG